MIKNGYYSELRLPEGNYAALREVMNSRDFWTKQLVSVKNQIHRWLDLRFPEYNNVFKKWTRVSSIITLKHFPLPSDIVKLSKEEIIATWKKHTKRHAGKGYAHTLLEQAKLSVGDTRALEEARQSLFLLIQQYEQIQENVDALQEKALSFIEQIPTAQCWRSVPNLLDIFIAGILAETGDPTGFSHGRQLLRLAGLHLGENSSGKHRGQVGITKRGRPGLRKVLFLAVRHLVRFNPEFRALHRIYVEERNMKRIKSIIKLCGKLARMLVGMIRSQEQYMGNKLHNIAA